MYIPFEQLSDNAKIWIYQSDRKLYEEEIPEIVLKLKTFIENWKNNQSSLTASYQIKYNRFIILGTDKPDTPLTIEAIDESVRLILKLQSELNVELLDKLNVCFKQGEFVQYKDVKTFQKLIKNKSISKNTIVFNNLINIKEELEEHWEIPITESWHNRFF